MKSRFFYLVLSSIIIFSLTSCEFGVDPGSTIITGQIVDSQTGDPVQSVTVKIFDGAIELTKSTDSLGVFSAELSFENDKELELIVLKEGYETDTLMVFIEAGVSNEIETVVLIAKGGSSTSTSGAAASIILYSQSEESIRVKESGGVETCQIIFEVLDSSGVPISQENSTVVKFELLSNPNGGEYLFPDSTNSNAFGRASVTLNSGTVAGVIQILATIQNKNVIRSRPILVSIHGGFPDQGHFDVAAEFLNYPAYGLLGYSIPFTAYVGDKYSNPVRPNTSVYFSTSSGIIEGSAQTNTLGTATVELLTQPFPNHSTFGPGFFEVTASTNDENSQVITTNSLRLLSGAPVISASPNFIDITNAGSQNFAFLISDGNGNPLAKGNTITVTVEEGDIELTGDVDVTLPDTQSQSFTQFSFTAYDSKPDTTNTMNAIIKISSSGPNGDKSINLFGTTR